MIRQSFRIALMIVGFMLSAFLVQSITVKKFQTLEQSSGAFSSDIVTIKTRERQLDCLAMNIYREAGHEPFEGKVGVAQVTLNRAASGKFPSDVCGVIYQKNVVMEKVVCQFSWACDSAAKAHPVNREAYNESMAVAKKVLLEGFRLDVLKDAMYYHAEYINPNWPFAKIGKIGQHIFYKGNRNNEYAKL